MCSGRTSAGSGRRLGRASPVMSLVSWCSRRDSSSSPGTIPSRDTYPVARGGHRRSLRRRSWRTPVPDRSQPWDPVDPLAGSRLSGWPRLGVSRSCADRRGRDPCGLRQRVAGCAFVDADWRLVPPSAGLPRSPLDDLERLAPLVPGSTARRGRRPVHRAARPQDLPPLVAVGAWPSTAHGSPYDRAKGWPTGRGTGSVTTSASCGTQTPRSSVATSATGTASNAFTTTPYRPPKSVPPSPVPPRGRLRNCPGVSLRTGGFGPAGG